MQSCIDCLVHSRPIHGTEYLPCIFDPRNLLEGLNDLVRESYSGGVRPDQQCSDVYQDFTTHLASRPCPNALLERTNDIRFGRRRGGVVN